MRCMPTALTWRLPKEKMYEIRSQATDPLETGVELTAASTTGVTVDVARVQRQHAVRWCKLEWLGRVGQPMQSKE